MRPQASSDETHRIAFGFSPPDDLYFATRLRDWLGERGRTAPPVTDRAAAARRASCGRGRLRDMPRRTQGECGSRSRRPGLRLSRDEDAAARTRQWPIPGLWEWRRARSASANKRPYGARDGPGWRAPNGNWCDRRRVASYAAFLGFRVVLSRKTGCTTSTRQLP